MAPNALISGLWWGWNANPMSALGHKRTFSEVCVMSAIPPKADIQSSSSDVRFVPKADIPRCSEDRRYSITWSARPSSGKGRFSPRPSAVFRLITRSNLVACMTGKSLGASPLRIRPV